MNDKKNPLLSKTIIASAIGFFVVIFGLDIDDPDQLATAIALVITQVGAIYGRIKAKQGISLTANPLGLALIASLLVAVGCQQAPQSAEVPQDQKTMTADTGIYLDLRGASVTGPLFTKVADTVTHTAGDHTSDASLQGSQESAQTSSPEQDVSPSTELNLPGAL